jgi:hypothetical protein
MKKNSNKFIQLTEVVSSGLSSHLTKSQRRTITINTDKIQYAFPESSGLTVLQMRRENIKVEEKYDDVLKKLNIEVPY